MSDIEFDCPRCGGLLVVSARGAGLTVNCTLCSKPVRIPEPKPQGNVREVKVKCPHCSQTLDAPEDLLGTVVDCPKCNKRFQLPMSAPLSNSIPLPPVEGRMTTERCFYCCKSLGDHGVKVNMHIVTNREGRTTGSSFGAAGFETTTTYNKTEITLPICGSCSDLLAKMRNGEIAAVVGSLFLTFPVFAFLVWEVGTLIFGAAEPKNEDAKLVVTCLIGMCAASTTGAMYADFKSRRFPDYINKSISCYPQIAELLRQGWDWGGCPGSEKPQGI